MMDNGMSTETSVSCGVEICDVSPRLRRKFGQTRGRRRFAKQGRRDDRDALANRIKRNRAVHREVLGLKREAADDYERSCWRRTVRDLMKTQLGGTRKNVKVYG